MTWQGNTRRRPPGWTATTRRIKQRDGHQCTVTEGGRRCTVTGDWNLEVDHIDQHGPDSDDNLASLCRAHHNRKTQREAAAARRANPPPTQRRPPTPHPGLR